MSRSRVLLADDHPIVAEGLKGLLAARFDVVGVVGDGQALLEAAKSLQPDVVVADLAMPLLNGIEVTARLATEEPQIKVVILTMHREEGYVRRAMEAGAAGYVLKVSAPDELLTAVDAALAGKTFVTPGLADHLVGHLPQHADRVQDPVGSLTPRQREIVQLVAEGKTAKEIGAVLGISARTVESHKYELMQALGMERGAELVQFAIKHGLIES
jgi:DNA-binding NarL/FixJ family response regulator